MDELATGGIVAAIFALVEAVKFLANKISNKKNCNSNSLTGEEHSWLKNLFDLHSAKDEDQVPVWYVPRTWLSEIKGLRKDITDLLNLEIRSTDHLKQILEQNQKILENILEKIRDG